MNRSGAARRPGGHSASTAGAGRSNSVFSTSSSSPTMAPSSARTSGSISPRFKGSCHRTDAMDAPRSGRQNQRRRTRKDLLEAAARLVKQGRTPSLDEVAEEALVSRATAYRHFPNVETLLIEASFDIAIPDANELFRDSREADPVARVQLVDKVLHDVVLAN